MIKGYEQLGLPVGGVERPIGELALRPPEQEHLFGVAPEEVIAIAPSVVPGGKALLNVVLKLNPNDKRLHGDQQAEAVDLDGAEDTATAALAQESETPGFNRDSIRKSKNIFGSHYAQMIQTGAQYLATFDDPEEGIRAGRKIFIEEMDQILGDVYTTRIVPGAEPIRDLNRAARATADEVRGVVTIKGEASVAQRYTILKALGYNRHESRTNYDKKQARVQEPEPEFVLTAFHAMTESDSHRPLIEELQAGGYDRLIALDVLRFLDGAQKVEGDLAKVQQLAKCLYLFTGQPVDRAAFYTRMVNQLDTWPVAQRQVITEARQLLRQRLETRLGQITRAFTTDDLIIKNPEGAFVRSIDRLSDEILRRMPVNSQNKAQLMYGRSLVKRGREASRREQRRASRRAKDDREIPVGIKEADGPYEPAKIVACSLHDYSVNENIEGMVDEFVDAVSQGSEVVRSDIMRILNFMARRDLPPSHRRGVKPINGSMVKFGTEQDPDKLWNFFELKPTEAAGLPTKTNVAKNCRVYFIKMDDNTLGIIGIKPRAEQDAFLRHIRVKIKRRGGEE